MNHDLRSASAESPKPNDSRTPPGCALVMPLVFAPPLFASLAIIPAVYAGFTHGLWYGVGVMAVALLVVAPIFVFIAGAVLLYLYKKNQTGPRGTQQATTDDGQAPATARGRSEPPHSSAMPGSHSTPKPRPCASSQLGSPPRQTPSADDQGKS